MILVKTELGLQVMKDRSVRLTPRQRSAFILFDGRRSVAEVLQASQSPQEEVDLLVELGLLGRAAGQPAAAAGPTIAAESPGEGVTASAAVAVEARTAQQRYQEAYPIATQLTASLGLRGFRLNLAVEAASTCEELSSLLPKIQAAVGPDKSAALVRALGA